MARYLPGRICQAAFRHEVASDGGDLFPLCLPGEATSGSLAEGRAFDQSWASVAAVCPKARRLPAGSSGPGASRPPRQQSARVAPDLPEAG